MRGNQAVSKLVSCSSKAGAAKLGGQVKTVRTCSIFCHHERARILPVPPTLPMTSERQCTHVCERQAASRSWVAAACHAEPERRVWNSAVFQVQIYGFFRQRPALYLIIAHRRISRRR